MGRGGYVDWRNHPEREDPPSMGNMDDDLTDTATSPVKPGDIVMTEKLAKRRLFVEESNDVEDTLVVVNSGVNIDGTPIPNANNPAPEDYNAKKRYKKVDGSSVSADTRSAASLEDDRQTQ
jgi:hypothetical protein